MKEKDKKRLRKFGVQLKKLRKEKGLSMRELAAQCDVDFSKIGKLETNQGNIKITTLFEIAEGLGVHPRDLLNFDFE